jgi:aspartyl protease family protein
MATGFMGRHFRGLWAAAALIAAGPALATDLSLVGAIGDKAAVIAVDGGAPRTIKVGQKLGNVTLIAVDKERAIVEVDGKRRVLLRGQTYSTSAGTSDRQSVTLAADRAGHFVTDGQVNGGTVRFLVDTGATAIALPASDAKRLGIDYRKGKPGVTQTAAGAVPIYVVRLDTVRVGGIELQAVDAIVIEQGLGVALLGMTFLNRVEMKRDGHTMTLTRRF